MLSCSLSWLLRPLSEVQLYSYLTYLLGRLLIGSLALAGPVPEPEGGGRGPDQRGQGDGDHPARRRLLRQRRLVRHDPRVFTPLLALYTVFYSYICTTLQPLRASQYSYASYWYTVSTNNTGINIK